MFGENGSAATSTLLAKDPPAPQCQTYPPLTKHRVAGCRGTGSTLAATPFAATLTLRPFAWTTADMAMLLRSDMLVVERRVLAAAADIMPRPPRWREREQQARTMIMMIDFQQCNHLTNHLTVMRAGGGDRGWQRFMGRLNKQTSAMAGTGAAVDLEADWHWLIELILVEYVHVLNYSWAWGASVLYVDTCYGREVAMEGTWQEIHLTGPDKDKYELEDVHIRGARRTWYDLQDGGKGGKRRMIQLIERRKAPGRETWQDGSFAPSEVANAANHDDAHVIEKWIDDDGGSPDAFVRMADQRGPAIEVCPATRLLTVAARKGCQTSVRALLERGADVKLFNDDGTTALMVAAEEARPELVRWLLIAKADPLTCDYDGSNALGHVQSRREKRRDRASIVDLLSRPESVFEAPLTGATILVTGLATLPQLNGRRGVAASYDAMSGRYVVQLENGPVVRVRPLNLAKFDAPLSASLDDPPHPAASEEGANRQVDADRRLRRVLHSDEVDLEALKAAINELHGHASAELLTEARRKREQLKERARKGAKAEIERLRKVRGEAVAATTAAAAAKESACAAAEGARAAAANEVATRQAEEAARQVEAALCVVCLDNAKTHVFVPCGHYSCCAECCALIANGPEAMRLCPLCKGTITMGMKVFG